jgi:hypothetical protein
MTSAELNNRLSFLAGKIALQLHQTRQDSPPNPSNAALQGALHAHFVEFSGLIMSAMLWENGKFRSILHTNLDTLQPFVEPLPQQHWLNALELLQLSEQQLYVLTCLYDSHVLANRTKVSNALSRNLQQQEVHAQAYNSVLLQQQQPGAADSAAAAAAAAAAGAFQGFCFNSPAGPSSSAGSQGHSTAAAAAAGMLPVSGIAVPGGLLLPDAVPAKASAAAVGREPMQQYGHVMDTQEALVEERHNLMRYWLLLGLHMGIVTACTLSPLQQVSGAEQQACMPVAALLLQGLFIHMVNL